MNACKTLALGACAVAALAAGAEQYAIVGATVHPLDGQGTLNGATVLIRGGRIEAVGVDVEVPAGAEVIEAIGKVVTPGIYDPLSSLGAREISLVEGTVDNVAAGRYGAGFDIADALNPRSTVIDVNRIDGVTRALVVPGWHEEGHVIGGQAAAIRLAHSDHFLVERGSVVVAWLGEAGAALAGGSRAGALATLREALQDADDYNRNREDYESGNRRGYSVERPDLEALLPVVYGRTPLLVYADRASDVAGALALKDEFDLKLIVAGGAEAWLLADEVAAADVAVILQPLQNLPASFASLNATLANAARLHEAGVRIAFSAVDNHNPRNLTQAAGNAVANGLPWEAALRAITVNPAAILGHDDECCTLEAGKEADLVVWSGDPLELGTFADQVFVRGERIEMKGRQTLLRDRYLDLDGDWPPAYRKP